MARITQVTTKEQVPPGKHDIFDAIAASRGKVRAPFRCC